MMDKLFVGIFEALQTRFKKELEIVGTQYPFEPLQFLKPSLRIDFTEGIELLRGAGHQIGDTDDLRYVRGNRGKLKEKKGEKKKEKK